MAFTSISSRSHILATAGNGLHFYFYSVTYLGYWRKWPSLLFLVGHISWLLAEMAFTSISSRSHVLATAGNGLHFYFYSVTYLGYWRKWPSLLFLVGHMSWLLPEMAFTSISIRLHILATGGNGLHFYF